MVIKLIVDGIRIGTVIRSSGSAFAYDANDVVVGQFANIDAATFGLARLRQPENDPKPSKSLDGEVPFLNADGAFPNNRSRNPPDIAVSRCALASQARA